MGNAHLDILRINLKFNYNCDQQALINPQNQQVEIYRLGKPVEIVQLPALLSGEDVLPGFELQF